MTTSQELQKIAAEFSYRYPDICAKLARLALDVQAKERALDEIVADAQDEADGAERVAAINRAMLAGVYVEFPPERIVRHIEIRSAL